MTTTDQTADRTRDVTDAAEYRTLLGKYVDHCEPGSSIQVREDIARKIGGLLARLAEEIETLRRERDDWRKAFEKHLDARVKAEAALAAAQAEIQKVWKATGAVDVVFDEHGTELSEPHEVVEYMRRILKAAQAENARLREWVRTVHDKFKRDEEQGYRSKDRQYAIELLGKALDETALSADMPAGNGEPVAVPEPVDFQWRNIDGWVSCSVPGDAEHRRAYAKQMAASIGLGYRELYAASPAPALHKEPSQ